MHTTILLAFVTIGCAIAAAPPATTSATTRASGPVEAMRWQRRVVIVFSSPATAGKLARQRELFKADAGGLVERRVSGVEVVGDAVSVDGKATPVDGTALARLRERYGAVAEQFLVVLVGLDGGEKLRRPDAVWPALLFETIDRMPMRQAERRDR